MTDLIAWLIANWLIIGIVALIALAFLIFLIASVSCVIAWYFWRWVIQAHDEPEPEPEPEIVVFGDVPQVPEKAKRRAA